VKNNLGWVLHRVHRYDEALELFQELVDYFADAGQPARERIARYSVAKTMRLMGDLMAASLPTDMLQLVVNKVSPTGLAPAAIGQTLRKAVLGLIPQDDATASASLQRSSPFVVSATKTPISAAHFDVVRNLTGGLLQQHDRLVGRKLNPHADNLQRMQSHLADLLS